MLFKQRFKQIAALAGLGVTAMLILTGCEYQHDRSDNWRNQFDISMPNLEQAGTDANSANADGWYLTFSEDFDGSALPDTFAPSPHGLRNTEYWCDQMIRVENGNAIIAAQHKNDHTCDICGVQTGDFTGGIETRKMEDGKSVPIFEQAFGYFEARVKLPESGGMWSAFWLQSDSVGNIGNGGEDGTEIDIYESSFYNTDRTKMGHALHYDGYDAKHHKCMDAVHSVGTDLYEGYHIFAVKWTPEEYVFYIDGQATWASDFGGVSKVPAFLRFTNEIRPGKVGPYSQKLGDFTGGEFFVDWVHVYQNEQYLEHIKTAEDFN